MENPSFEPTQTPANVAEAESTDALDLSVTEETVVLGFASEGEDDSVAGHYYTKRKFTGLEDPEA